MKKYGKFVALIAVILGTLGWLAVAGSGEAQSYYKTISEVRQMGNEAAKKRLRVAGDIEKDSIQRRGSQVDFVLVSEGHKLNVTYTGNEPLPDTFRDGAQALADGKLDKDGVFRAAKIQAKCASKYEVKPGQPGATPPNVNTGKTAI